MTQSQLVGKGMDMKSGEANRKHLKFSINYQLWRLFGIFGFVFSPP